MNTTIGIAALTLAALLVAAGCADGSESSTAGAAATGRSVQLGQAGAGRLVRHREGARTDWTVYLRVDGRRVAATEPSWPSFDSGPAAGDGRWRTWVTRFGQLRTSRTTDTDRRVWSWEVAGPGEGGRPDPAAVAAGTLVATRIR